MILLIRYILWVCVCVCPRRLSNFSAHSRLLMEKCIFFSTTRSLLVAFNHTTRVFKSLYQFLIRDCEIWNKQIFIEFCFVYKFRRIIECYYSIVYNLGIQWNSIRLNWIDLLIKSTINEPFHVCFTHCPGFLIIHCVHTHISISFEMEF